MFPFPWLRPRRRALNAPLRTRSLECLRVLVAVAADNISAVVAGRECVYFDDIFPRLDEHTVGHRCSFGEKWCHKYNRLNAIYIYTVSLRERGGHLSCRDGRSGDFRSQALVTGLISRLIYDYKCVRPCNMQTGGLTGNIMTRLILTSAWPLEYQRKLTPSNIAYTTNVAHLLS